MKKVKNFSFGSYLWKNKFKLFFYVIFMTGFYLCNVYSTLLIAQGIEKITFSEWSSALFLFGMSSLTLVLSRVVEYLAELMYSKLVRDVSTSIRNDLSQRMFKISSMCFNQNSAGMFVSRITSSPIHIIEDLASAIESIGNIVSTAVTVVYIACLNVYIGLIMLAIILILAFYEFIKVKIYSKNRMAEKKENDNVTSHANEIVRSEKDIKSQNLEEKLGENSVKVFDKLKKAQYKRQTVDAAFWNIRWGVVFAFGFLIVMFAFSLRDAGYLATAGLLYIFMNTDSIGGVVWNMGNIVRCFADIRVEAKRIGAVFDDSKFPIEKFGNIDIPKDKFKGKITFRNVYFAYKDYEEEEDDNPKRKKKDVKAKKEPTVNKVIKNLSFCIKPGQTVAFVGRSGSGKSTILSLIPKLYECDKGEILIDGVNVKNLTKETLRENISLVNQFPYIFNASIKENLLMANKNATEKDIYDVLKKASLLDFVMTLKKGINTVVGEGGVKLSGGQRQRLAIARALLKESKIIIFDESTSSLDNFAQEEVRKSIEELQGERTVIIVAHRLSTIRNADVIYLLDQGKAVAKGTFDELYEKEEKFRAMFMAENLEH